MAKEIFIKGIELAIEIEEKIADAIQREKRYTEKNAAEVSVMRLILAIAIIFFGVLVPMQIYKEINAPAPAPANYGVAFTVVEELSEGETNIVYHNDTHVMYTVDSDDHFTVLVNPDGSPMVYETPNTTE